MKVFLGVLRNVYLDIASFVDLHFLNWLNSFGLFMNRFVEGLMKRVMDGFMNRVMDGVMSRPMDRIVDRAVDRFMDRTVDRAVDRLVDRPIERLTKRPFRCRINLFVLESLVVEVLIFGLGQLIIVVLVLHLQLSLSFLQFPLLFSLEAVHLFLDGRLDERLDLNVNSLHLLPASLPCASLHQAIGCVYLDTEDLVWWSTSFASDVATARFAPMRHVQCSARASVVLIFILAVRIVQAVIGRAKVVAAREDAGADLDGQLESLEQPLLQNLIVVLRMRQEDATLDCRVAHPVLQLKPGIAHYLGIVTQAT